MEESLNTIKFQSWDINNSGRSKSSRLLMESLSSECIGLTGYQKVPEEEEPKEKKRNKAWKLLRCVFVKKEGGGDAKAIKEDVELESLESKEEDEKKKMSEESPEEKHKESKDKTKMPWHLDPNRRWPQGW